MIQKNRQKKLSLILALVMLFSVVGCSKTKKSETSSSEAGSSTETTIETEASTQETTGKASVGFSDLKERDNDFLVNEDPKYQELIDAAINGASDSYFKGVMALATDDDVILFGCPGAMSIDNSPADPYTIYEVGSISKTYTAVMIMKLIDQGKMTMDDTLSKYFPEYKNGREVTIANLLNMQSGILDYVNRADVFFKGAERDPQEIITTPGLTDEEFLSYLYAQELYFEPGTRTDYSNTNYHLLALIIEQITGESFRDAVKREIFDPLGMEHSSAMTTGDETSIPDPAIGYHQFQEGARGAGDIHSCMADMVTFDRALFGGDLVSVKSLMRMKDFKSKEYGCGLYSYGKNSYGHQGSVACYTSENIVIETEEFGRVYLIASTSDPDQGRNLEKMALYVSSYLEMK